MTFKTAADVLGHMRKHGYTTAHGFTADDQYSIMLALDGVVSTGTPVGAEGIDRDDLIRSAQIWEFKDGFLSH